jgi:hypothetical protein
MTPPVDPNDDENDDDVYFKKIIKFVTVTI